MCNSWEAMVKHCGCTSKYRSVFLCLVKPGWYMVPACKIHQLSNYEQEACEGRRKWVSRVKPFFKKKCNFCHSHHVLACYKYHPVKVLDFYGTKHNCSTTG